MAEFDDMPERQIREMIRLSNWDSDKIERAQRYLDDKAIKLTKAGHADQVRVAWAAIIVTIIIATIGALYAVRHHIKPLIDAAVAALHR
jgi:hypothetical protein